jgi:dGTPase
MAADELGLAPYAVRVQDGGARVHPEPDDPLRAPFVLDRHRILECAAFRRLEHKTQVFLAGAHDHFRTRLTHTLEVADIARTLAAAMGVNEFLAEAIALAHDLGHPPFGHAGEAALDAALAKEGGFNHNAHSLRVVEFLEHPFPAFRGLNLTAATRAGLAGHETQFDRPVPDSHDARDRQQSSRHVPFSIEAQIVSLADRLAFNVHDWEDALEAGLMTAGDWDSVSLWAESYRRGSHHYANKPIQAVRRTVLEAVLDGLLRDAITATKSQVAGVRNHQDLLHAPRLVVALSPAAEANLSEWERFLGQRVYRHPQVVAADDQGRRVVLELFAAYRRDPSQLPDRFAARVSEQGLDRVIGDYVAGMTDRFCLREHNRLVVG